MKLRVILRNECPRTLQSRPQWYCPAPDRQRPAAKVRKPAGKLIGGERGRCNQGTLELPEFSQAPARSEHLAAAGIEHCDDRVDPTRRRPRPGAQRE